MRDLTRYLRILRSEAEAFLQRACCHEDAIKVWASYFQLRDVIIPAVLEEKRLPPGQRVEIDELIDFIQAIVRLRSTITDDTTAVDGTVIDALRIKHEGNHQKMMHEFCRLPLLQPGKKARRPMMTVKVSGVISIPMPGAGTDKNGNEWKQ